MWRSSKNLQRPLGVAARWRPDVRNMVLAMIQSRSFPLLRRCWPYLAPLLPVRIQRRLKKGLRNILGFQSHNNRRLGLRARLLAVLHPFGRRPKTMDWDCLRLQLDAICRELRRLHMRLDELQEATEGRKSGLLPSGRNADQQDTKAAA
jgi:hypothetical protein